MESSPIVFDISSDDDEATLAWEEPKGDDYDWLSEVLEAVDKGLGDLDEVVVVGEVNPTKKSKSSNSVARKVVDEDDGDCVVLEGDPDKALSDVNDPQQDSDECLIVGQKGQEGKNKTKLLILYINCQSAAADLFVLSVRRKALFGDLVLSFRIDLGALKFSMHLMDALLKLQCHCFVCDTRAPCCYWGSGISTIDHCHATDKEEMWKTLRKTFRHGRTFPISLAKAPVTSYSTATPRVNQASRCDNMQFTQQNQVSRLTPTRAAGNCMSQSNNQRPSIIRACSSSTRFGIPYNPNVGSQRVLNRTMQSRSVSQHLLGVHNTVIRRDRGIRISNLASQFVPSNTMSKRMEVASTMNRTAYVPVENITSAIASQHQQNPASLTIPYERNSNPIGWPNFCPGSNLGTYTHQGSSQPSVDGVITNSAPSQYSAYSQAVPQSSLNQDTNQLQNQNQPAAIHAFSDYDLNWVNNIGVSNQQSSVDHVQLQTPGSTNEKEPSMEVNEGDRSFYSELENFLLDDQSIPGDVLAAELNPLSPNHASIDTGMNPFDIDTSWDCLTRV
ncbi:hypothetical protein Godav_027159 [Gossypium davidsonii]|uniref:Uncharacterized protein n=1 Tax=Gossypium davidsonii TaxID=34287 RepID=A0A7J8RV52_GOSDV|nr:hypothetical protein [Gossypium davidsonii]